MLLGAADSAWDARVQSGRMAEKAGTKAGTKAGLCRGVSCFMQRYQADGPFDPRWDGCAQITLGSNAGPPCAGRGMRAKKATPLSLCARPFGFVSQCAYLGARVCKGSGVSR